MRRAMFNLFILAVIVVKTGATAIESEEYAAAKADRHARRVAIGIEKADRRRARVQDRKDRDYYPPMWYYYAPVPPWYYWGGYRY